MSLESCHCGSDSTGRVEPILPSRFGGTFCIPFEHHKSNHCACLNTMGEATPLIRRDVGDDNGPRRRPQVSRK